MSKTCAELFDGLSCTILGDPDEKVTGLAFRSDQVEEGDAFFCIVGLNVDGHTFAQDAIDRGAKVIVAERKLYLADATDVIVVVVSDTRQAMGHASKAFFDDPSSAFKLVGITGTNGKTTTTYLVESIASHVGYRTGVIGTVGMRIQDESLPAEHTTPESPDLQRTFAMMRDAGCEVVAMEVSSHALDLKRTWGCDFDVVAFTNLTQDHLDYHHTFEDYFQAKALLFGEAYPAKRVIGIDSEWGRRLLSQCGGDDVLTTGFSDDADIHPLHVDYSSDRTYAKLSIAGESVEVGYPLIGRFNVENVMCAIAISLQLGISLDAIIEALSGSITVPGRLERICASADTDVNVFVDYAHTPDALEKAISSIRELAPGRVVVVFGCGGDRDSSKRPIMGKAALAADHAIVTNDNPRTEDPQSIIDDIVAGMREVVDEDRSSCLASEGDDVSPFEVIPDRKDAIFKAILSARPNDCILIAGKGHEDYQIIGTEKVHFDDREIARLALEARSDT